MLALPPDRMRPMLETLVELFDAEALSADGTLDISLSQAAGARRARGGPAAALARRRAAGWLGRRGCAVLGVWARPSRQPGLRATLRHYQRHGPGLAAVPRRTGAGRHPGRRYGPGQDRADAGPHPGREGGRPARRAPAWSSARPASCQLAQRGRAVRARACGCWSCTAPSGASCFAAIARHDLVLTTYALLLRDTETLLLEHDGTWWCSTRRRRSRTRPRKLAQHRLPAQGRAPAVPDRHADREPSGRAVVAVHTS